MAISIQIKPLLKKQGIAGQARNDGELCLQGTMPTSRRCLTWLTNFVSQGGVYFDITVQKKRQRQLHQNKSGEGKPPPYKSSNFIT